MSSKQLVMAMASKTWPQLLVLKDKHEDSYYLVNDVDALWRTALAILEKRIKDRYIQEPYALRENQVEEVSDDIIDKLPDAMRAKAYKDKAYNQKAKTRHDRDVAQWADIQKALKDGNGVLAYEVLRDRKDAEYEGFSFERLKVL